MTDPSFVDLFLNNVFSAKFELDSGSHVSTLSYSDAMRVGGNVMPTSHKIIGYSGVSIELLGEIYTTVRFNGKSVVHNFPVVKDGLMCKFELNFTCSSHNVVKDALQKGTGILKFLLNLVLIVKMFNLNLPSQTFNGLFLTVLGTEFI